MEMDKPVKEVTLRDLIISNDSLSSQVLNKAKEIASLESDECKVEKDENQPCSGIRGELLVTSNNLYIVLEILSKIYHQLIRNESPK